MIDRLIKSAEVERVISYNHVIRVISSQFSVAGQSLTLCQHTRPCPDSPRYVIFVPR